MTTTNMTAAEAAEARRLEDLWGGDFGDGYVERNRSAYAHREGFWQQRLAQTQASSVLEVGCNIGGNLEWVAPALSSGAVVGLELNNTALAKLAERVPAARGVQGVARALPFPDRAFDLTFTMGVLIHQPEETLGAVMDELVRCTRRWLLCGEYHAETTVEVPYRGQEGALFKRNYAAIYAQRYPQLKQVDGGFKSVDEGWDDVTWSLFQR